MSEIREKWHLDRRVPLTIIVFLTIQTASFLTAAGWYVGQDHQWKKGIEAIIVKLPDTFPPGEIETRLSAVENNQLGIVSNITQIKKSISRLSVVENNQLHTMATLNAIAKSMNITPPGITGR